MDLRALANPTFAVVAAVYGLLWALAGAAGLFGIPMAILLVISIGRYGYRLLGNFARGRNRDIAPDLDSIHPIGDYRVVLHAVFFALLPSLAAVAHRLPWGAAVDGSIVAAAAVLCVVYPASAAWLALTGDLGGAMSPHRVLGLIRLLGRRYALLVAACAGLLALAGIAAGVLAAVLAALLPLPGLLAVPLGDAFTVWAALGIFVLTGSEIRSQRNAFGIPGEAEPAEDRARRERRREWQVSLDRAYGSIRSGLRVEGYRTIGELVEREQGSLEVQQWVFENMLGWEDKRDALAFASRLVETLLERGEPYEALELVTRCRRYSASFELSPAVAASLAEFARSIGRDGIADELAAGARGAPRPQPAR